MMILLFAAAFAVSTTAAYARPQARPEPTNGFNAVSETGLENAIGQCWMERDGTIVLDLRRTGNGIHISMPPQRYAPSDPQYAAILEHVGPLRPGEFKLVRQWPEKRP